MSSAGKASSYSRVTGRVLQTETGLVSLSDFLSRGDVQQVIVTKSLHTVVMPEERERERERDTDNVLWKSPFLLPLSAHTDGLMGGGVTQLFFMIKTFKLRFASWF